MTKQKRSLKKRYVFCISAIALLLISYFVFLCVYSRTYTMSIYLNRKTDLSTVKVECSSDNVVRVSDIHNGHVLASMNSLEIDIESVGHGQTDVTVYYEDSYDWEEIDENDRPYMKHITEPKTIKESFHVSYIGNIWCSTDNNFKGIWTLRLLIDAIMIVLVITFSLTFREKQKNGDFTYSMVTLGGLIFFMLATVVLSVYDIVSFWDYMPFMNTKYILLSVSTVSNHFIEITLIPLVLFCLVLSISNIRLVRHEGFRVQNLLGFILGVFVAGGIAAMYFAGKYIYSGSLTQELLLSTINSAVSVIWSVCWFLRYSVR